MPGHRTRQLVRAQDLLEGLLRFCYTGECQVAKRGIIDLLVLADRLNVPALQAACEKARKRRNHPDMQALTQTHCLLMQVMT